jgi:hypothetical protein
MTFFYKVLFPAMWLGALVEMFRTGVIPDLAKAFIVVIVSVISLFMLLPLKQVIATDNGLLVSNFLKEVLIPYSQFAEVHERTGRPPIIIIFLKTPSRFGTKIAFIPRVKFGVISEGPAAVHFLRSRITA